MRRLVPVLMAALSVAPAQERPTPPDRRDLATPRDSVTSQLPTIDLPEYIITGIAFVDLPRVEKRLEDGDPTANIQVAGAAPVRDRSVAPAPSSLISDRPSIGAPSGFAGYLKAGIGSFMMPQVLASVRPVLNWSRIGVNGRYGRSSGFAPWTSWSEGEVDGSIDVPVDLETAGLRHATLSSELGFDSRSYHWYGTQTPWERRKISSFDGGAGLRGFVGSWAASAALRFGSSSVDDSSAHVTEGSTRLRVQADGDIAGFPIGVALSNLSSRRSGTPFPSTGLTEIGLQSRWQPVGSVWLSGGLRAAIVNGNSGQSRFVFLPTIRAQLSIDEQHRLVGAFEPRVEEVTLVSSLERHRFIDAQTPLRFGHWYNAGRFGLESDWTPDVRTRVEVEAGTAHDLPFVSDSTGRGVASWLYGDASMSAVRAECIAKMRGNDYFAATVIVRTSRNSSSGLRIPYWPAFEARFSYAAVLTPSFTAAAGLQIVHTRESQVSTSSLMLPGYAVIDVSGKYALLSSLSVWLEATNLTNTVYQHWKGLQEPPFRLSAGIALAW